VQLKEPDPRLPKAVWFALGINPIMLVAQGAVARSGELSLPQRKVHCL
jgi:hypothetical protein